MPPVPSMRTGSGRIECSEKTGGKAFSNSPTTRSKVGCGVSAKATSVTSASENVSVPPSSVLSAAMPCWTASAQRGLGTPSPMLQVTLPSTPAAAAADTIWSRAWSVSAEQTSKVATPSSMEKRNVNGVMTGRGALISSTNSMPSGAARLSAASIWAFSDGLLLRAVTATRSAATEIFERGRTRSASRANSRASFQPSGTA